MNPSPTRNVTNPEHSCESDRHKKRLLMRHAKSSWEYSSLEDIDRPLNERGKRAAVLMAELLQRQGLSPDLIVTSNALRTLRTAEIVAAVCRCHSLVLEPSLYMASAEELERQIRSDASSGRTLWLGHNPGIEEMLSRLNGSPIEFPTAALACLEIEAKTAAMKITKIWRPKQLA